MSDWREISKEAAFVSHRLIGWIYWDPDAINAYTKLGIPDGFGYYVTSRAGLLGKAGSDSVSAAYYSIHPEFVNASYKLLNEHADVEWMRYKLETQPFLMDLRNMLRIFVMNLLR